MPGNSDQAIKALLGRLRSAELPPPDLRKSIRAAAGVSLRDAAKVIGVSPMTLLRWERGDDTPTREHATSYRRLLDALDDYIQGHADRRKAEEWKRQAKRRSNSDEARRKV